MGKRLISKNASNSISAVVVKRPMFFANCISDQPRGEGNAMRKTRGHLLNSMGVTETHLLRNIMKECN